MCEILVRDNTTWPIHCHASSCQTSRLRRNWNMWPGLQCRRVGVDIFKHVRTVRRLWVHCDTDNTDITMWLTQMWCFLLSAKLTCDFLGSSAFNPDYRMTCISDLNFLTPTDLWYNSSINIPAIGCFVIQILTLSSHHQQISTWSSLITSTTTGHHISLEIGPISFTSHYQEYKYALVVELFLIFLFSRKVMSILSEIFSDPRAPSQRTNNQGVPNMCF